MRTIKNNKRAFLLGSETLKIILAVICILFLIYLLVALYFSVTGNEKVKQSQAILNGEHGLAKEISRVAGGGEFNAEGFHVLNPSDWFIFSFVGDEKKPNLCAGANCVCICEEAIVILDLFCPDCQVKRCDEKGACAAVSNLKKFDKIKIESKGVWVLVQKIEQQIEVKKK